MNVDEWSACYVFFKWIWILIILDLLRQHRNRNKKTNKVIFTAQTKSKTNDANCEFTWNCKHSDIKNVIGKNDSLKIKNDDKVRKEKEFADDVHVDDLLSKDKKPEIFNNDHVDNNEKRTLLCYDHEHNACDQENITQPQTNSCSTPMMNVDGNYYRIKYNDLETKKTNESAYLTENKCHDITIKHDYEVDKTNDMATNDNDQISPFISYNQTTQNRNSIVSNPIEEDDNDENSENNFNDYYHATKSSAPNHTLEDSVEHNSNNDNKEMRISCYEPNDDALMNEDNNSFVVNKRQSSGSSQEIFVTLSKPIRSKSFGGPKNAYASNCLFEQWTQLHNSPKPFKPEMKIEAPKHFRLKRLSSSKSNRMSVQSLATLYSASSTSSILSVHASSNGENASNNHVFHRNSTSSSHHFPKFSRPLSYQQPTFPDDNTKISTNVCNEGSNKTYKSNGTQTETSDIYVQRLESEYIFPIVNSGLLWFSNCTLSFGIGSLLGELEVKLSCRFFSEITLSDQFMITPEVTCLFDTKKLQFPFDLTMPTCFASTYGDNPARIDVIRLNSEVSWKRITSIPLQQNLQVTFSNDKVGSYQCIVVASEFQKISKSILLQGFLEKEKDGDYHNVVICAMDDYPHLETRNSLEMTTHDKLFSKKLLVRYKEGMRLSVNGKFEETTPTEHEISNEDVWKSCMYRKYYFKVMATQSRIITYLTSTTSNQGENFLHVDIGLLCKTGSSRKLSKNKSTSSLFKSSRSSFRKDTISETSYFSAHSSANDLDKLLLDDAKQKTPLKKRLSKLRFGKSRKSKKLI